MRRPVWRHRLSFCLSMLALSELPFCETVPTPHLIFLTAFLHRRRKAILKLKALYVGINTAWKDSSMATWTPDPTFYPSPRLAMKAPQETLAYVASFDPDRKVPDALAVVDVDPASPSYSTIVGSVSMPHTGDELHHFGWNACSSCLC